MQESLKSLLQRIEQINCKAAAQGREVIAVGSFQALLDPLCDLTWLNYAVPVEPLGTKAEVAEVLLELREVFSDRDRILRLEFTQSLWPELPKILEEVGLQLEARQPMMLCTAVDFQPYNVSAVQVQHLSQVDDTDTLAAYLCVRNQGFDYDAAEPPTAKEIAELREQLETGNMRCVLAHLDGIPAGVGATMPLLGICELVGVATCPALRRRGVAATLSSFLVKDHFEQGGDLVWLSAGDQVAQTTYERIGFRSLDSRLNYIDATVSRYRYC